MDGENGLARAWREHEGWLRSCASAWGVSPGYYIEPANTFGLRFVTSEPRGDEQGPFYFGEALMIAGDCTRV